MTTAHRCGLMLVLLCAAISILPPLVHNDNAWVDFRAVYAGTRCLLSQHNPYNVSQLDREYRAEDGQRPPDQLRFTQSVTLYVNFPTTFVLVAPFALLPWGPAHLLWFALTTAVFLLALLLIWKLGADFSLEVSTLLMCLLAANCQGIFVTGNTAGIVVGLCAIAVWCFLGDQFVWAGVLCLGVGLAIKPHDCWLIWLYFVLAGGVNRKRALQSSLVAAVIALAAVVWISHTAPGWLQDWRANIATISAPGGIDDPGPNSVMGRYASIEVDLQAAIGVFRDNPVFYRLTSYLLCGGLLLAWAIRTLRSRFSQNQALAALSAATAFSLLIAYHRPWDAKLVMLAVPACCALWAGGKRIGKMAFLLTIVTVLTTGDFVLGALTLLSHHLPLDTASLFGKMLTVLMLRPASLALFAMGVFYLWLFWLPAGTREEAPAGIEPGRADECCRRSRGQGTELE